MYINNGKFPIHGLVVFFSTWFLSGSRSFRFFECLAICSFFSRRVSSLPRMMTFSSVGMENVSVFLRNATEGWAASVRLRCLLFVC